MGKFPQLPDLHCEAESLVPREVDSGDRLGRHYLRDLLWCDAYYWLPYPISGCFEWVAHAGICDRHGVWSWCPSTTQLLCIYVSAGSFLLADAGAYPVSLDSWRKTIRRPVAPGHGQEQQIAA